MSRSKSGNGGKQPFVSILPTVPENSQHILPPPPMDPPSGNSNRRDAMSDVNAHGSVEDFADVNLAGTFVSSNTRRGPPPSCT
jgi:hypothetical protein